MTEIILGAALVVAAALVTAGAALVYTPAGFIVGGVLVAVLALAFTRDADVPELEPLEPPAPKGPTSPISGSA